MKEGRPTQESPDEKLLKRLGLLRGGHIHLIKRYAEGNSAVNVGDSLEGDLDSDVELGKSISLDKDTQSTTRIKAIAENDGKIFLKTETSIYELVQPQEKGVAQKITYEDLQRELDLFSKKGYGEWDMMTQRVRMEDNPYQLLLKKNGFEVGDKVVFFAEKERRGTVAINSRGELVICDEKNNPWGLATLLQDGWLKRATD